MARTRRAASTAAALVLAALIPAWLWWPCCALDPSVSGRDAGDRAAPASTPPTLIASADWGTSEGLKAPRCVRVDALRGRVYVFGTDGKLHRFTADGRALGAVALPGERNGNPQGLHVDADGNLLVADTHAHCVLRLRPDGSLLARYGTPGTGAGEFHWPTGVCEAADRTLWVTEYGEQDRLHHLTADGNPIGVTGRTGSGAGEFYRPSNVAVDAAGAVWVADACNHRLQVFTAAGEFEREFQLSGAAALRYPYDLSISAAGDVTVTEYGAHRLRAFDPAGHQLGSWGAPGAALGELGSPWGSAPLEGGFLVADTDNHRLQWLRTAPEIKLARGPNAEARR